MSQREDIPDPIKRIIRQEANFGCVICGNPLIEYAHIIPYATTRDNRPENLVALCPTDHTKYDLGGPSEAEIRKCKSKPFNSGRDVRDRFSITGDLPIIEAGTNICTNTPVLLVVDYKNIITLIKEDDELTLNAVFYDQKNALIAYIKNNEWCALSNRAWDIVYQTVAKNLVIRTKPRDIVLRLRIRKGVVHLSGQLYYNGYKILISPKQLVAGGNACFFTGCSFDNCITAIAIDTKKGSISIGTSIHEDQFNNPVIVHLRQPQMSALYKRFYIWRECKFCHKIQL